MPAPVISTIAGNGSYGYSGDGGPATSAMLYVPFGTCVDSSGDVFIADTYNHRIREVVKSTGNIITVAGTGTPYYNGDGGPATSTNIGDPYGVAVDAAGNLYIADNYNDRIREVVKSTGAMITIAGTGQIGYAGDGAPATLALLYSPYGIAVDSSGNVFFADQGNNRIREIIKSSGTIITVAGTGTNGYNGDNRPATSALLNQPNGVAVDANGNLFVSDWHNNRIREVVKATGTIVTIAGTGTGGYNGDNGPATSAMINYPGGVAVDANDNVFIGDSSNERIREVVNATGIITTVAGTGGTGFSGDGGSPTAALLDYPNGVAVDASGNIYFDDTYNYRIREVLASNSPSLGSLSSTAWTVNQSGFSASVAITGVTAPYSGLSATGLPPGLTAALSGNTITLSGTPTAAGDYGNVTLSIQDSAGNNVTRTYSIVINSPPALGALSPTQWTAEVSGYTGVIPVSGGTGPLTLVAQSNLPPGLSATVSGTSITFTGIPTATGTFSNVQLTVRDAAGASAGSTFSIAISAPAPGSILTIAGTGTSGYSGDGGPANLAKLYSPFSVAVDASGNVFIADFLNARVREIVKATGNIVTVAGTGVNGYSGDGGPATSAKVYGVTGVAVDATGNLYIADLYNNRIREVVKATGNIITVAGNGSTTDSGDGGLATAAGLNSPEGVAVDASGNIYIADAYGNRIREVVAATGTIITVAGTGTSGYSGDNGPATAAMLNYPNGVAVDGYGDIFIADTNNQRVREVLHATGNIITIAGSGAIGYSGDGGPATAAKLYSPTDVAVDSSGNVFIADGRNSVIRVVAATSGNIFTVAGTGTEGYSGDGGPATVATLDQTYGVAVDGSDDLFIADTDNNAVREVLPIPSPVLGSLSSTAWTVNQPGYSGTIAITNAAPPSGAFVAETGLPSGLSASLNGSTITVSGTPTVTGTFGNITISLLGPSGTTLVSRTYSMTINAAPTLGALGGPTQWTVGRLGYGGTIPISGGTGALTVSSQVNVPNGLTATVNGNLVTFTGAPEAPGTYSHIQVTVRDTTGATSTGTYSITINSLPTLGALSNTVWTANQPGYSGTVTVQDGTAPFGNLTAMGLPPGLYATQSGNVITISGTPTTTGTYNNIQLSVQDSTLATASGTFTITISGPAATLSVSNYPTSMTAGATGSFTVTALDASGNVATGYRGTVYVGSSDPATGSPTIYTFTPADNGVHTFTFTVDTAGSQQLYARDPNGIDGFSAPITVSAAALNHFAVTAPQYSGSYYGFNVTVSAKDAYNNTISGYNGTVHFASSDSAATFPADYAYTSGDQGSHTFSVTLQTPGTQTIVVNDSNNVSATGTVSVQDLDYVPGLHFTISPSVTTTMAGAAFDVTVTALDEFNNVAVHYDGTVRFSSTDQGSGVVLPADYTFAAADAGVHTFASGVTLVTAGNRSLTVVDTATVVSSGNGLASASITVDPAPVSVLTISGLPSTVIRGAAQAFTVTGEDPYGNTATSYDGTIHFTSSDAAAVLQADTVLTGGAGTFRVVFASLGTEALSVADTANGALTATQGGISVNPAPAVRLAITGFPNSTTAGASATFSVAAMDAYGYVASGFAGTVHFTSSDPLAVLPANVTLTNGIGSFSATLKTAGAQSLTATDTANASLNGTEGSIAVTPAAATTLSLTGFPSSITAGVAGTATVTATDAYGNVATGYTGTVHVTGSDPQEVLPADYTFTTADAGSHTFAITFKTAAWQSLTVADTTGILSNGSQSGIAVNAAAAASLTGSAPATNIPNSGYPFSVWTIDAYGNYVRAYAGTVHITSSDPQAVLPADYTYTSADAGSHNFVVTLKTVGNQTITVTDTGSAGVSAFQFNVNVQVGPATGVALTGYPSLTTAGVVGTFTVRAYDIVGNTATGYTGTVHFTSSDFAAFLPADYTFTPADAGVHTFSATLITAGEQGLWVRDAQNNFTSAQYAINVTPAAVSRLVATSYHAFTTAGVIDNVTVTAEDAFGNVATSYGGSVHFASSDSQAGLPADYTFTATDSGVHTFAVVLKTAGSQTVSFQDAQAGFSNTLNMSVTAGAAGQFVVSGFPSPTTAGFTNSFTVRVYDLYGNAAIGYTGTVHFTSSDAAALLPANYTFTSADAGMHTFSASLVTAGSQSLGVQDAQNNLAAAENGINVNPAAATKLVVTAYQTNTTAGVVDNVTVAAEDVYGNVATSYSGIVHFSSSDSQAGLPADYTFTATDSGVHTFAVILKTAGSQTLSIQDAHHSFSTTANIAVTAAAASRFVLSGLPSTTTAGVVQNVTLTALDAYGNVATGYTGTVHLTSSDPQAVLPANYSFSSNDNGVHTFAASLCTAGTQSLTATDTANATLTASQGGISVVAGALSKFTVSGYPATTAGASHNFRVAATDAYGNVITGYRGTVHFTSSDQKAGLPSNYTFKASDNGVHTFSATLKTSGSQSLTVTDTATPSLTGSQSGIPVTAAAATHFVITAPANVSIGVPFSVTVTALDAYGNIATGYLGTIHFTSSDSQAILPNNYTFVAADGGVHTFTVILKSNGTQTLTAADTHTGSIKGSASITAS